MTEFDKFFDNYVIQNIGYRELAREVWNVAISTALEKARNNTAEIEDLISMKTKGDSHA